MYVSELEYDDLTVEIVDKILYEGIRDDGENGDCILVFGSRSAPRYRVPKAVELHKKGRADKIILSGGKIIQNNNISKTEACYMKDRALELGIQTEKLIQEEFSVKSTKENVLGSLMILDREFGLHNLRRILVVSASYHMRRCQKMLETYMPDWIEFTMCGADDANTCRHNWYLNEEGFHRAKMEAYKISCYIREGTIKDFKI